MTMVRVAGALIYVGGAFAWAIAMAFWSFIRCDSCNSTPGVWFENPQSWQYDAIVWFGWTGLALAALAFCLSLVRQWIGFLTFWVHVAVFLGNLVIIVAGRSIGAALQIVLPAALVACAGFVAVGGHSLSWPRPKS